MLKPRYLLIWVIISFILLFGASWSIEMASMPTEATQLDTIVNIASDMALQGGQGIDDFFVNVKNVGGVDVVSTDDITEYKAGDANPLQIWVQDGINKPSYDCYSNIFKVYNPTKALFGNSTPVDVAKSAIFDKLYNTDELREFAEHTMSVTIEIPYVLNGSGKVQWVKVPKIALMGAKLVFGSDTEYNSLLIKELGKGLYSSVDYVYGWSALSQNGYLDSVNTGTDGEYYLTPSKLGISYVNKDLVEFLYQNNLDLLMRAKYATDEGGDDIRRGNGLVESQFIPQNINVISNINNINRQVYEPTGSADIINNGNFAICKSQSNISSVEYMTIDIYNSDYDEIIEQLYSAGVDSTGGVLGQPYKMTAEKLKEKSTKTDRDGNPLEHSYITVAKVTFTADIILPYKTGTFNIWRTSYDGGEDNYADLVHNIEGRENGATESTKYEYTRYYCVSAE